MPSNFTWLHLSDLHAGISSQSWLWPTFKHTLYDDLQKMIELTGRLDAVIFSGDLTQCASREQFTQLDESLGELWSLFFRLGCSPVFVCVPGNHDLERPKPNDPALLLLKNWWDQPVVRADTWDKTKGLYRKRLDSCFANYSSWNRACALPIAQNIQTGIMPGDFSATLETPDGSIGLVGLNSAWLQLDDSEAEGNLCVDPRQLHAVTSSDPVRWCRANVANILVTHHPPDWLHRHALEYWQSDINPPGRFDAHLFGHMHVPDATSHAHGGAPAQRAIQGASIFGLEHFKGGVERIQGYSIARLQTSGATRDLTVWPRRLHKMTSGARQLVADQSLTLGADGSFTLSADHTSKVNLVDREKTADAGLTNSVRGLLDNASGSQEILHKVRAFIPPTAASAPVRLVEQMYCLAALNAKRAVWVGAEWGAGLDGFVGAIQSQLETSIKTYRIDLADYGTREDFLATIKQQFDFTFESFCDALSNVGDAILILDEIPAQRLTNSEHVTVGAEVEALVDVMLQYCPGLRVIMHSRHPPDDGAFRSVALRPLDEADLRAYVADHPHGGEQYTSLEAISALYRHTDGMPARIDTALRELEIVTIEQLSSANRDLVHAEAVSEEVPSGLVKAVADLSSSEDPMRRRAFDLLKALAAFPHGESLERIKRFYGPHPLFPAHALELTSRSLITSTSILGGDVFGEEGPSKLLVVPRPVRDYVRSQTSAQELRDQTRRAAALYFGENWPQGQIRESFAKRLQNPMASNAEITNASAIVVRLLNDAIELQDSRAKDAAMHIAAAYINALNTGDHFRSVITVCGDILSEIGDEKSDDAVTIRAAYGKCLRMLSKQELARDLLVDLAKQPAPKSVRQRILVNLALAHQSLDEPDEAIEAAKEVVRIEKNSQFALQAQSIILEVSNAPADELKRHEDLCRKSGAHTAANNLAITRLENIGTYAEAAETFDLILGTKEMDFYNGVRVTIRKVTLAVKDGEAVSDTDKTRLINAYGFLFGERMPTLFDGCHHALWRLFGRDSDSANLLRLFRHSSLIWRLRGDDRESRYLKPLAQHARICASEGTENLRREIAYYNVRAAIPLLSASEQVQGDPQKDTATN
jgi:tetratricopeptide (TPR) repeat protein